MTLVHNEQTELLANALDRASTACLSIGFLAPTAAAVYTTAPQFAIGSNIIIGAVIWILVASMLHYSARRILRRLR